MTVHFIGAGPGAPDLITVRGLRLIESSPVCLYAGSLVPAAVVVLDSLPLGATGKVDRARLPAPAWQTEDFVPPATPAEEIVAGIWSEVLEVERVGATDDFFDLGGHSLLVTKILSRIRDTFGVELPLKVLFEASNVRDLAAAVEAERFRGEVAAAPPRFPQPCY